MFGIVVVAACFVTLLTVSWMWGRGMIIGGSILLGALVGVGVGFGIGVALGPGPEAGHMYGIEQLASGVTGAPTGSWSGPPSGASLAGSSRDCGRGNSKASRVLPPPRYSFLRS